VDGAESLDVDLGVSRGVASTFRFEARRDPIAIPAARPATKLRVANMATTVVLLGEAAMFATS